MPIEDQTRLSIDDLKTIIHGLRMSTFSFVEDDAMVEIGAMIKALPPPEEIDKMTDSPKAIKNLQMAIGNIMRFIELYGKRDIEYKVRYRSRTDLPPRYKVLEWRDNMRANATEMTKELVRLSSLADDKGYGEESAKLLKCAKKVINNQIGEEDVEEAIVSLRNIGMEKEAQAWQKMKGFFGGLGQGVKGALTNIWQSGQAGGLEAEYKALYDRMVAFKTKIGQFANQQGLSDQVKQRIQALDQAITYSEDQINKAAQGVKQASEASVPAAPTGTPGASTTSQLTPETIAQPVKQPTGAVGAVPSTGAVQMPSGIAKEIKRLNVPKKVLLDYVNKMPDNTGVIATKYNLKIYKLANRK